MPFIVLYNTAQLHRKLQQKMSIFSLNLISLLLISLVLIIGTGTMRVWVTGEVLSE